MRRLIYKILSIILIPIVVFSTTSFSIFKHECGGQLYSLSIIELNDGCGMDMNIVEESCELTSVKYFIDSVSNNCCKSDVLFVSGSLSNLIGDLQLENLPLKVLSANALMYLDLFQVGLSTAENYEYYIPPIRVIDIPILYQVFQI